MSVLHSPSDLYRHDPRCAPWGGTAAISRSWRARPLTSHEVVIETIRATTITTGLTVDAELDLGTYEKGIKISDQQIKNLEISQLHRHEFHGDWNYRLDPRHARTHPPKI